MYKGIFPIPAIILAAALGISAQVATPTPTPLPETVPVPTVAPGYENRDLSLPELGRVGVDLTNQQTMTLQDAIEAALGNNLDIEVTRKTEEMSEFDLKAAKGVYQPRFLLQTYNDNTATPNLSVFSTNLRQTAVTQYGNADIIGYIPRWGTTYGWHLNTQRVTSDNPITILSPQVTASSGFSITQPLFRGRKFDVNRRNIEIAKRNIQISDTQFRQRAIETVANVQRAYWDLTYALRNLQVQRDAVRDAKSQLEHNRRLVNEGSLAPIDIVAAETQVANFEQSVYDALNAVNLAENNLKGLISPGHENPIWGRSITPVEPVEQTTPDPTLGDAVSTAFANRPELELNEVQRDINRVDQRLYKDQQKPQVDLTASISSVGVGGSLNPNFTNPFASSVCADPSSPACLALQQRQQNFLNQIGGSGSAFTDIFKFHDPAFRLGVNINLPLFGKDRTASAFYGRSLVEAERLDTQREQLQQNIQIEVRNALQAVRTNEARLRAASIARENTARQYESEQRKLDNGQSDVYRVLERQTALAAAQSAELRARTDLNKSIADYERATGSTLKANNVEARLKK
ncbi:MAG TPA: TolC family protein [Pyrinomonadaceae bacterium]|nr:TolC family protein [Pyrinomonadaceae bacterium]